MSPLSPPRRERRRDEDRHRVTPGLAGLARGGEDGGRQASQGRPRADGSRAGFARAFEGGRARGDRVRLRRRRHGPARRVRGGKEIVRALALNDVVVARGKQVRSINVAVRVDGEPLIVYWADGLIVATATGSTAYGFSVGGPLILPASRAITMVPIAPHLSFGNAVVFDPDQVLELEAQDEPSVLSLDGQEEHDLRAGDRITVRRAATVARFARTAHARPFVELLREKILKEPGT